MEAEVGQMVRFSFICKLEDGTVYEIAYSDTLEFVIGRGSAPPSLEKGMLGMKPGELRTIRVPGSEAREFPFDAGETAGGHSPAGAARTRKLGYDFAPGEEAGDVLLSGPSAPSRVVREPPAGGYLFFEVELIGVEDTNRKPGE